MEQSNLYGVRQTMSLHAHTQTVPDGNIRLKAGGFQAAIHETLAKPLAPNQEADLGLNIELTQKQFAKALAATPATWNSTYKALGESAELRVKRLLLDSAQLPTTAIDHLDRTMLAVNPDNQGSEHALCWVIESHRLCPDFLLRLYSNGGDLTVIAGPEYAQWRKAVNALVEQFYRAAIKIYWGAVRSGDQDPDEVTSDAMRVLIRCAERYNPDKGSFGAFFMTFARYAQLKRLHSKLDEASNRADLPDDSFQMDKLLSDSDTLNTCEPELSVGRSQTAEIIQGLVTELPEQERLVISHYFDMARQSETQRDLAKRMGLTPGRISQIKSLALKKLKRRLKECDF